MWRQVQRGEIMSAKEDESNRSREAAGIARTDNDNRKEHSMTANRIDALRNRPTRIAGNAEGICTLPAMQQEE